LQNVSDSLHDFYLQNSYDNIGLLSASQKAINQGFYAVAANLNNWVNSNNQMEINQKFMNKLVLKRELGQPLSSSDSVNLLDIALQCKIAGGNAVLQARAMYSAINHKFRLFEDNCLSFSGARLAKKSNKYNNLISLQLYPNPAHDFVELSYKMENNLNATFKIYDLTGTLLESFRLANNSGKIIVNTASLTNGLYICNIENNGVQSEFIKLVVIQ
jgi:ribosomal protein S9